MKPHPFPIATLDSALLSPMFAWNQLRLLLFVLTLSATTLLIAAPARAQTLHRALTFEPNRKQAPDEVKWLGHRSTYRALFAGSGATFLHRDENDTRAMAERQPAPAVSFRDRGSSHGLQATPKPRRPLQKPDLLEKTPPVGRRLPFGPQTSSDRVIPSASQFRAN
jgi:hypothetical protein